MSAYIDVVENGLPPTNNGCMEKAALKFEFLMYLFTNWETVK